MDFRSTFRDWVEESTNYGGTVAEAALAHVVGDKVEKPLTGVATYSKSAASL